MKTCKFCGQQTNDENPEWFPMTRTGTMGSEYRCVVGNECDLRAEVRSLTARLEAAEKCIAAATDNTKTLTDFDAARAAWEATK